MLREIKVSDDEFLNLKCIVALNKEIAKIKEENEILKKLWPYLQQKTK